MRLIAVVCVNGCRDESRRLARMLSVPMVDSDVGLDAPGLVLELDEAGLKARQLGAGAPGPVWCDFVGGELAHRRLYGGGKGQAIARAVGISTVFRPRIVDLTAGLGRDGFVLASLGARVTLVERHPVVAALLADGLDRARRQSGQDPELLAIMHRMVLTVADGGQWLAASSEAERPDVVYLDPMFPERTKSARVKKEMALFQSLVGIEDDGSELLAVALTRARYRVVVKRPRYAPPLDGRRPDHQWVGKSTRFDIHVLKKLPR